MMSATHDRDVDAKTTEVAAGQLEPSIMLVLGLGRIASSLQ